MNRIVLAYAPENVSLAESIDHQLGRLGIPFEHARTDIAAQIAAAAEPVLLLVTDNFLKSRACLDGLLPQLQGLAAEKRLLVVLADGLDAQGNAVPTQIDRMANALHYMKHWQDAWLALSDEHQKAGPEAKVNLVANLDATRAVANAVGDIIGFLREQGSMAWKDFEADAFAAFFERFNLKEWHGQYKRLVAQDAESQVVVEVPHLPEMPLAGGLLSPEPIKVEEITVAQQIEPTPIVEAIPQVGSSESAAIAEEQPVQAEEHLTQAIRDAWFWIEKGHMERGLELFRIALEQFPQSETLRGEYERAMQQSGVQNAEQRTPESEVEATPAVEEPKSLEQTSSENEVKSYDLMGDMAAERGDYLFAKYCWDRVVELDDTYPNIFRKLGLMAAEHLQDYRETAAIYLQKALLAHPEDAAVRATLAQLSASPANTTTSTEPLTDERTAAHPQIPESPNPPIPESPNPQIPESPNPQIPESPNPQIPQSPNPPIPESPNPPIPQSPNPQINKSPLILITGATSGIGRATAEIFARNGYRLILTGRRVERLVALKNQFEADFGSEVLLLPFDVRDPGSVEAALNNLPEPFQAIDILVNNAGLAKGLSPIHEGNLDHWETMIDTNVKGLLYVTRLVSKGMVQRGHGHIINVGSSAGKEAYPNGNVYCATKFAVDALTKAMRFDLHTHNIRVSQVSPGHVEETEFALNRFDGDAERAKIYNDFQPLRASDVAEAIYFMATRPPHVNIQDIQLFATQQASSMVIHRSGRD